MRPFEDNEDILPGTMVCNVGLRVNVWSHPTKGQVVRVLDADSVCLVVQHRRESSLWRQNLLLVVAQDSVGWINEDNMMGDAVMLVE